MLNVKKEGVLLTKTEHGFEDEGVLNPAVIQDQNGIHLFYRAVSKGNYSTIGYCKLSGPLEIESRSITPILFPQFPHEEKGVEDPRIVKIDDLYYLTYTAYDGVNALGALATSNDLEHWEKYGLVVPKITYDVFRHLAESKAKIHEKYFRFNKLGRSKENNGKSVYVWDKNVVFFPRRINGKLHFLHRVKPEIQLVAVTSLSELTTDFWHNYFLHLDESIVLSSKYKHELSYIGSGCPPIETQDGWLVIYHGVHDTIKGYVYTACAALLDINNPQKEIARLPYALFKPDEDWELTGYVNNVCFPSGTLLNGDTLYIYYGAADEQIATVSLSLSGLLKELALNTCDHENKN